VIRVKEVRVENAHDFSWQISEFIDSVMKRELKEKEHYATGHLSLSNRPREWTTGDGRVEVVVENNDPAAYVLHFGSKPHAPPLYPLIEWAMAKYADTYDDAVKRALRVRAVIRKKGNKAYHWVDGLHRRMKEEMERALSP